MSQPTITINIAEAGTPLSDGKKSIPGHMWYEIADGNGHSYSFGFAPDRDYQGSPFAPGFVYDNDSTHYLERDATKTLDITIEQFNALLSFARQPDAPGYDFDKFYNGLTNSCVDFTWKALQIAGILPIHSADGDLLPTFNEDEIQVLGNNFVSAANKLAQENYHDTLTTQGLNEAIVYGESYFLSVSALKDNETKEILSPSVLFQVTVDRVTGETSYRPIAYPTPSPEADNPTTYVQFDPNTGDTKIYNANTLTTLTNLSASHHLTLDQLLNLPGNEHLIGRTISGDNGAQLFLYKDTDHVRVTAQDNDFDYVVLNNGHPSYDPDADNPPITGPVNNSLLDFSVNISGRLGDVRNAWQTGSALLGANYSANMPINVLNGDGLTNTAPSSMVANDFRPGNIENSHMAQIWSEIGRTTTASERSMWVTLGHMVDENVTSNSSAALNYFDFNSVALSSTISNVTSLNFYYTDSPFLQNTDPLILDLNNDGVHLTNFKETPVLFNTDADSSKEQTGWVSKEDGILVLDKNHDGIINDLTETFSEFFAPNVKNGFEALATLDSNRNGEFDAADTQFNEVRVWVDANHNGLTEEGELRRLQDLNIQSISLRATLTPNQLREGNALQAVGVYTTTDGQTHEAAAVNFLTNPMGSDWGADRGGIRVSNEAGDATYTAITDQDVVINVADKHVANAYGAIGNDTLIGDAQNNWLGGGAGSDSFQGGAGDDLLMIDNEDLQQNIDGGEGFDIAMVSGDHGVRLNLTQAHIEMAVGGAGNDLLIGGGSSNVFIRAGAGDDTIIGGNADDALSGEDGDDLIDGGLGDDIIRGHRGNDTLIGGKGDDYLEGGKGNDQLFSGDGNDILVTGEGNDTVDGGADIDTAQFSGSYADYHVTTTANGVLVTDTRDAANTSLLKNVEKLSFKDLSEMDINTDAPMPVKDVIAVTRSNNNSYTIRASDVLANDIDYQGDALHITSVSDAVGGNVTFNANNGLITFTADPSFQGVMSFKYQIADRKGNVAEVYLSSASTTRAIAKGQVTLQTPDQPHDALFADQWYLSEINVLPVWRDYTGKGVDVGVFELGFFDRNHADLKNNVSEEYATRALPEDNAFSSHATLVTGVIAAERNNSGSVGVAYDAKVTGEDILADGTRIDMGQGSSDHTKILAAKQYDITNNSYGPTQMFHSNVALQALDHQILQKAAEQGRNGLGTVMIFAGGNERAEGSNTNSSSLTNNSYVITSGGANKHADLGTLEVQAAPFSNPGASILTSAPASNVTSTGQLLENSNGSTFGEDYTVTQGTSFATPVISGVAALMLEANPALGYRDVQTIMAMASRKFEDPDTDWNFNGARNWNGGAMHTSHDYGFGMIDAYAAVRLAETWTEQNTAHNLVTTSATQTLKHVITDLGTFEDSITIADALKVEFAKVSVVIDHSNIGDLVITLISPTGTESILVNRPGKAPGSAAFDKGLADDHLNFSFATTHDWGESSIGTWKIRVADAEGNDIGALKSWSLKLSGSPEDGNDTYVFTNELGMNDQGNHTIIDQRGEDTINAAAVLKDSTVNLGIGATSIINGKEIILATNMPDSTVLQKQEAIVAKQQELESAEQLLAQQQQTFASKQSLRAAQQSQYLQQVKYYNSVTNPVLTAKYNTYLARKAEWDEGYGKYKVTLVHKSSALTDEHNIYIYRDGSGNSGTWYYPSYLLYKMAMDRYDASINGYNSFLSQAQSEITQINSLRASVQNLTAELQNDTLSIDQTRSLISTTSNAINALQSYIHSFGHGDTQIENAFTGDGNDTIIGNDTNNILFGGRGSDSISGGAGSDKLIAGVAAKDEYGHNIITNDTLAGGADRDTFVIQQSANNHVTITDFNASAHERIELVGFSNLDFGHLSMHALGLDTVIELGGAENPQTLTIKNISPALLTSEHFVFTDLNPAEGIASLLADEAPHTENEVLDIVRNGSISFSVQDLIRNDFDVEEGTVLFSEFITQPLYGTLIDNHNGTFTYTAHTNFLPSETLFYNVMDSVGNTSTAALTIYSRGLADAPSSVLLVPHVGTSGNDTLYAMKSQGVLADGGAGNDTLYGSVSSDTLVGGEGNDKLYGDKGDDTLIMNGGTDYAEGGEGQDHFVIPHTAGSQTIGDFDVSTSGDIIDLRAFKNITSFSDLVISNGFSIGSGNGKAAYITDSTHELRMGLVDVNPNVLLAEHFIFRAKNQDPTAVNDTLTTDEDTPITFSVAQLLANDSDVEDGTPQFISIKNQSIFLHATLNDNHDGTFIFTPDANWNGVENYTYTVQDSDGVTKTATLAITVNPVNDGPTAKNDRLTTNEDTPLVFSASQLLSNDSDREDDKLSFVGFTNTPTLGTLTTNADGSFIYAPNINAHGVETLIYQVHDKEGAVASATLTLDVGAVNDAPVAVNDLLATNEDTPLTFKASQLLVNDSDVEDGVPQFVGVNVAWYAPPLQDNGDGTFTFTPLANWNGTENYTYTVRDSNGATRTATVSIRVIPVNDAPVAADDTLTTNEDRAIAFTASQLLSNDSDREDGKPRFVDFTNTPTLGTLTTNADGSFIYAPNINANGVEMLTYQVHDKEGAIANATLALNVRAVNDAPAAVNDVLTADEDTPLIFSIAQLLANDSDVEDGMPQFISIGNQSIFPHTTLTDNHDGTFVFRPDENWNGMENYTYIVRDSDRATRTATLTITVNPVNDGPIATNDILTTNEDTPITFDTTQLLLNDLDVDVENGKPSFVGFTNAPRLGTLVTNTDGSFTYTPNANANGVEVLAYQVQDQEGAVANAKLTLEVQAVNDAPVAMGDTLLTNEDIPLIFSAAQLLANDFDIDEELPQLVSIHSERPISHSQILNNGDGTFTLVPIANWSGTENYIYTIKDSAGLYSSATLAFTANPVNDAPTASGFIDNGYTTIGNILALSTEKVTFRDAENNPLTYSATLANGAPLPEWLAFNPSTKTFNGTPTANDSGVITVLLIANDGEKSTSVPFTISVGNNQPAVAGIDVFHATLNQPILIPITQLLANDVDPESGELTFKGFTFPYGINNENGLSASSFTVNASGLTYTPTKSGINEIGYLVQDSVGQITKGSIQVSVETPNHAPTASDDILSAIKNQPINFSPFQLLTNDSDIDGETPQFIGITSAPRLGTLIINPDGTFTYTPTAGVTGQEQLTYQIRDAAGLVSEASIKISITEPIDPIKNQTPASPTAPIASTHISAIAGTSFALDIASLGIIDDHPETLRYQVLQQDGSPLPAWLQFDGKYITGVPIADAGEVKLHITANDGVMSVGTQLEISIMRPMAMSGFTPPGITLPPPNHSHGNEAPQIASYLGELPAEIFLPVGSNIGMNGSLKITDANNDPIIVSATLENGEALPGWLHFEPSFGAFYGDPSLGDVGTIRLKITANDGIITTSKFINLTIGNAPAPEMRPDVFHANTNQTLNFSAADLLANDNHLQPGTELTSLIKVSDYSNSTLTDNHDGTFSFKAMSTGQTILRYETRDATGHTESSAVHINAGTAGTNKAPTLATPALPELNFYAGENTDISFFDYNNLFRDNGEYLNFSIAMENGLPLPSWMQFVMKEQVGENGFTANTKYVAIAPTEAEIGTHRFLITASDGEKSITIPQLLHILAPSAPLAEDDHVMVEHNGAVTLSEEDVIANDASGLLAGKYEWENTPWINRITEGPTHGSLSFDLDSYSVTYTPESDFSGTDRVAYEIINRAGMVSTAAIYFEVQSPITTTLLEGGAGDDVIRGGNGNDVLNGGTGADQLFGGAGLDIFVFDQLTDARANIIDRVEDFSVTDDHFDFSGLKVEGIETYSDLTITQDAAHNETIISIQDPIDTSHTLDLAHLTGLINLQEQHFMWG